MEKISVTIKNEAADGWEIGVVVKDEDSMSQHHVSLSRAYWKELTNEMISPEELLTQSFEFLLTHEPKELILTSFSLDVIEKYFPEYKQEITSKFF